MLASNAEGRSSAKKACRPSSTRLRTKRRPLLRSSTSLTVRACSRILADPEGRSSTTATRLRPWPDTHHTTEREGEVGGEEGGEEEGEEGKVNIAAGV